MIPRKKLEDLVKELEAAAKRPLAFDDIAKVVKGFSQNPLPPETQEFLDDLKEIMATPTSVPASAPPPPDNKCVCSIKELLSAGHASGCPEKKK